MSRFLLSDGFAPIFYHRVCCQQMRFFVAKFRLGQVSRFQQSLLNAKRKIGEIAAILCFMAQAGGPTTESGILFQNSVASLFLGDLLDTENRPDFERVIAVRIEAPTHVDDTVVTYGDGHRVYIQAKERLAVQMSKVESLLQGEDLEEVLEDIELSPKKKLPPWVKLWHHFEAEFFDSDFGLETELQNSDRLLLYAGSQSKPLHQLYELCSSADGANNATEWFENLPKEQSSLVKDKIQPLLKPEHQNFESLLALLAHVDVEFCSLDYLEKHSAPRRMPSSSVSPATLFDLLITATGRNARKRKEFGVAKLRADLKKRHNIEFKAAASNQAILAAVTNCNLILEGTRSTIGQKGGHQPRAVTQKIVDWLCRNWKAEQPLSNDGSTASLDNVAIVHTVAGMGKTVVLHNVLLALKERKVPTLAIKADSQLRRLSPGYPIEKCLNLPDSIERVVERLSRLQPEQGVVVILDQLDALSLSLAHDQFALEEVVKLITQLRAIPRVRLLLSCRTFDLNTDPTLKLLSRESEFAIEEFLPDESATALSRLGVDPSVLSPATSELLRVPLHLDLLALAIENRPDQLQKNADASLSGGVATLQDLHELLWDSVIEDTRLPEDEVSRRSQVIGLLVEQMQKTQRTSVTKSLWTQAVHVSLRTSVRALAGAGILVEDKTGWRFWHQTFYDYCAARRFAEGTESLAQSILESDQGLPQRPRMIQILAYLRAKDEERYLQSLHQLLQSPDLEDHLRDLLIRWFAALHNPTEAEWEIAQFEIEDSEQRKQFLERAGNGVGWFAWLLPDILPSLFQTQESDEEADGLNYLRAMLNLEMGQEQAAHFLLTHLDASQRWNERLAWLLSLVIDWQSETAISLFEEVCSRWLKGAITGEYSLCEELPRIVESPCFNAPDVVGRVLQVWFSVELDRHDAKYKSLLVLSPDPTPEELEAMSAEESNENLRQSLEQLSSSVSDPLQAFNDHTAHYILDEVFDPVAERSPKEFLELVVSVVERAVPWTRSKPRFGFKHDPLIGIFRHDIGGHSHRSVDCLLHDGLLIAAKALAEQPDELRPFIARLKKLDYASPQAYVAAIYRQNPAVLADEAADFLCEDVRRLYLGFATQSDSASLIAAIFPFLKNDKRKLLESAITRFEITDYWRDDDTKEEDLQKFRGQSQLRLLLPIAREFLTSETRQVLEQLEIKFPEMQGYRPLESENVVGTVRFENSGSEQIESSPTATPAKPMSDDDWVRLIKHHTARHQLIKAEPNPQGRTPNSIQPVSEYEDELEFEMGLPNDARQLATGKFKREIIAEPERFARFATARLPRVTYMPFVVALIEGLTESDAPSATAYEVVRHFEPAVAPFVIDAEFWRSLVTLVEARKAEGVPDDILEMLERHLQAMALPIVASSTSGRTLRRIQRAQKNNIDAETPSNGEEEDEIDESLWLNTGPLVNYLNDWHHHHLFEALMKGLAANERNVAARDELSAQNYRQRRWNWIEWTAQHPSDAVRCGGLIYLMDLFDTERKRAFELYEKLVEDHLELSAMFYSMEVLRHGIVWFYPRVQPYIEQLLGAEQAAIAQRGALLATIAAWNGHDAARVEILLQGRPAWRRGVAKVWGSRVFANGITLPQRDWCRNGLQSLVTDEDQSVQRRLNRVVRNLKSSDWSKWQPFLQSLISSSALAETFDSVTEYIWENGKPHKAETLDLVEQLIQNPVKRRRGAPGHGGDPLVRAVLNVYNSPLTSPPVKTRCIKLFGRLLREFSGDGNKALSEWDQSKFTLG